MASDSEMSQSSKLESEEAAADTNPAWKGASKRRQKKGKESKKEERNARRREGKQKGR